MPVTFVRFTEERVEGFPRPGSGTGVGRDGERCDVGQLLAGILTHAGLVQTFRILEILRQPLQEGQRLAEIHLEQTKHR